MHTAQTRLPDFRPVMAAYFDGVLALGLRTLRLMAMALDLPPDWFAVRYQKPLLNLRPLHYSAALSRPEEVTCLSVLTPPCGSKVSCFVSTTQCSAFGWALTTQILWSHKEPHDCWGFPIRLREAVISFGSLCGFPQALSLALLCTSLIDR